MLWYFLKFSCTYKQKLGLLINNHKSVENIINFSTAIKYKNPIEKKQFKKRKNKVISIENQIRNLQIKIERQTKLV